MAEKCPYFLKT
jgi:hypothetical protein